MSNDSNLIIFDNLIEYKKGSGCIENISIAPPARKLNAKGSIQYVDDDSVVRRAKHFASKIKLASKIKVC